MFCGKIIIRSLDVDDQMSITLVRRYENNHVIVVPTSAGVTQSD